MRDTTLYLKDILAAIDSIQSFVAGMTFDAFQADDKTVSAVVRKFEIIGEAARHIPEHIRIQFPIVPWKEMSGMRDRLIHFYFGVDMFIVWATIHEHLPALREVLKSIISESGDQPTLAPQ
jgi:uncharacterized protein with HEPN domain